MKKGNGIHLLYKKLGETPLKTIERFKDENPAYNNESMTYAGRLDPMAEGLLLALSGEEVYEKDTYLDLVKSYTFEVLWGFETDTLDVLGMTSEIKEQLPTENDIKKALFSGVFEQSYPAYSSKPVEGKPLFEWAREGNLDKIQVPKHEVEIFQASFVSRRQISGKELLNNITQKVTAVSGDFRQKEILEKWQTVLVEKDKEEFVIDTISVKVSSGFYVRQFVSDIAKTLRVVATTFHIKRTKIGDFDVNDCV